CARDLGVARIGEQGYELGASTHARGKRTCLIDLQIARRFVVEYEAREVGPGAERGVGRGDAVDAANLDQHAHGVALIAPRGRESKPTWACPVSVAIASWNGPASLRNPRGGRPLEIRIEAGASNQGENLMLMKSILTAGALLLSGGRACA